MVDQIVSFSNKNITYQTVIDNLNILDYDYYFQLVDCVAKEDAAQTLLIFDKVLNNGFDGGHFISGLATRSEERRVGKGVEPGGRSWITNRTSEIAVAWLL